MTKLNRIILQSDESNEESIKRENTLKNEIVSMTDYAEVPEWLFKELPEIYETTTIVDYSKNKYSFLDENRNRHKYETLGHLISDLRNRTGSSDFSLSSKARETLEYSDKNFPITELSRGIKIRVEEKTDMIRYNTLAITFREWIKTYDIYENNPKDFNNAFNFVNNHPAFWTKKTEEPSFEWNTTGIAQEIITFPILQDDRPHTWELNIGTRNNSMTKLEYPRISHENIKVENAYIGLAEVIYSKFDNYGNTIDNLNID